MPSFIDTKTLLTEDFIQSEFGLSCEGIPVTGVRMIDHTPVLLYKESDVVRPEKSCA